MSILDFELPEQIAQPQIKAVKLQNMRKLAEVDALSNKNIRNTCTRLNTLGFTEITIPRLEKFRQLFMRLEQFPYDKGEFIRVCNAMVAERMELTAEATKKLNYLVSPKHVISKSSLYFIKDMMNRGILELEGKHIDYLQEDAMLINAREEDV